MPFHGVTNVLQMAFLLHSLFGILIPSRHLILTSRRKSIWVPLDCNVHPMRNSANDNSAESPCHYFVRLQALERIGWHCKQ